MPNDIEHLNMFHESPRQVISGFISILRIHNEAPTKKMKASRLFQTPIAKYSILCIQFDIYTSYPFPLIVIPEPYTRPPRSSPCQTRFSPSRSILSSPLPRAVRKPSEQQHPPPIRLLFHGTHPPPPDATDLISIHPPEP